LPRIVTKIDIKTPVERAFDLSRSIEFHAYIQSHNKEKAVDGITSGLIGLNEKVTWEAVHFFIKQTLTAKITHFDNPYHFRDTMIRGAFKRFDHDHKFEGNGEITHVTDIFDYDVPHGIFGKVFDVLVLKSYMTRFFNKRNLMLKETLESDRWKDFI
jgi:ligand-binding SRPBCC domain-containing protein